MINKSVVKIMILSFFVSIGWIACKPKIKDSVTSSESRKLPVFKVRTMLIDESTINSLASSICKTKIQMKRLEDRSVFESDGKVFEIYNKTGGVWISDNRKMWNADLEPSLPEEKEALQISQKLLNENKIFSFKDSYSTTSFRKYGGTYAAIYNADTKERKDKKLDIQVIYDTKISPLKEYNLPETPVVGGGGEINVTIGDKNEVLGLSGVSRPVEKIDSAYAMIDQKVSDELFKKITSSMENVKFSSYLAYYSAPSSELQEYLYPVYVYKATSESDGKIIPLRNIILPATSFSLGQLQFKNEPVKRDSSMKPLRRSTMQEGVDERGDSKNIKQPLYANYFKNNGVNVMRAPTSWKECATEWIGESGGLGGSNNNAKGFRDGLSALGWNINFNWHDATAWESDFIKNDDQWVDAADFVFYTGHAWLGGWVVNPPDGSNVDFAETGSTPESDIWGGQDLEWLVVAACGPLQDDILASGGGNVFTRWKGAFDGLHLLMGYGAITFDNEEEGKKIVQYAKDGNTLIDSWFRAAREIQPTDNGASAPDGPTIWVGVVYCYRSGTTSSANDHIWDEGSVAPDPINPNVFVAIWTTC